MPQRQYDKATAQALMQLAYPEYENLPSAPYIENDDGLYVNESFRAASPPGAVFDWTPADDMGWPGSPNPNTAPFLPIPFTASELAACMLDGPGQSIQFALDRRIGYPLDDEVLASFRARHRWMRDALEEAYALAAAAQLIVGEFDYDEKARTHTLVLQYDDADGQANAREGVFEHGINTEEARARRARAVASVADLKAQAKQAQAAVADKWKAWRKAMVFQLLGTGAQQSHVAAQSPATPAPSPTEPTPTILKKKALITQLEHEWPSIEADLKDATRNGLKDAAATGVHGEWFAEPARAWAQRKGKLKQAAPAHPLDNVWPGTVTRNKL